MLNTIKKYLIKKNIKFIIANLRIYLLLLLCMNSVTFGDNGDGAADLGVDYAFIFLTTMSPDFTAANYIITNESDLDIDISIGRFPFHISLMKTKKSNLILEIALAYQKTKEVIPTLPTLGENIDAKWNTYGAGLGLEYEYYLSKHLLFTPSLRFGLAKMRNHARFNGELTNILKPLYNGKLFNWNTYASVSSIGLGVSYIWKLLDRFSTIKVNAYRTYVNSFNESNSAVVFNESANMIALKADLIFPTGIKIYGYRLDFILLHGTNNFFGENRNTLGYTTSYQAGTGIELPIKWKVPLNWKEKLFGYIRLSGQFLWAENMKGWLWSVGLNLK